MQCHLIISYIDIGDCDLNFLSIFFRLSCYCTQEKFDLRSDIFFCSLFILQVLETDQVTKRFYEVTSQLEQALANIPFNELDVSDEVREQVQFHFLTKTILFFLNEDCIVNYLIQIGWHNGNYLT